MTEPSIISPVVPVRAVDVIRKKRDQMELSRDEITSLVQGYTSGEIPDYQAAAWLMAAVIRGLTRRRPRRSPTRCCARARCWIFPILPRAR